MIDVTFSLLASKLALAPTKQTEGWYKQQHTRRDNDWNNDSDCNDDSDYDDNSDLYVDNDIKHDRSNTQYLPLLGKVACWSPHNSTNSDWRCSYWSAKAQPSLQFVAYLDGVWQAWGIRVGLVGTAGDTSVFDEIGIAKVRYWKGLLHLENKAFQHSTCRLKFILELMANNSWLIESAAT